MDTEARRICDEVLKPLVERFEAVSQAEWDSKCHDPTWLKDGKPADMYGSIEDWYETLDLGLASAWIEFNLGVDRDKRFREVLLGVLEAVRRVDRCTEGELWERARSPLRHVDEKDFQKAQGEMLVAVDHLQRLTKLIEASDSPKEEWSAPATHKTWESRFNASERSLREWRNQKTLRM